MNQTEELERLRADLQKERDRVEYLSQYAKIPACETCIEYDPGAGSTYEYSPPAKAVELFGDHSLLFNVGCGPYQSSHYRIMKQGEPLSWRCE